MSQTTYYEFNKPIGSDLVNPLTDTFPNWDIADSALHELNERSIANCTEVVSLGVHAISRLNTDTKFLKWIATANFTAGDTFTVDGNVVAAATASGEALSTGAYVTGAVILACLNADDSAMTVFVTGTNVASDSARLGGELPSYYATEANMSGAQTDITNLQNLAGNNSIVGIGDGTLTGAVSAINSALSDFGTYSTGEKIVGKWFDQTLYRKCFTATPTSGTQWLSDMIIANATIVKLYGIMNLTNGVNIPLPYVSGISVGENVDLSYNISNGVLFRTANPSYVNQPITIVIEYVKTN